MFKQKKQEEREKRKKQGSCILNTFRDAQPRLTETKYTANTFRAERTDHTYDHCLPDPEALLE